MGRSRAGRQVRHVRWRCTANVPRPPVPDDSYDPDGYRLVPADPPLTLAQLAALVDPSGSPAWLPATGLVWGRAEFLALPWVSDWMSGWEEGERYCEAVTTRYGDFIPADLAVLEAAALDFQGVETSDREASFVHESHVCGFAGLDDLHLALLALYRDQWIVPLTDGTLAAPRLALAPVG
ncbi:hypothetical protein [Actinocorallia populi]|uniref:hypothetical protein n=1 Tax=Actinocorallia populi TaxID=2079200 RepID=UPI000D0886E4|nr:hypothetical protein [Actinocorallia populi]